MDLQLICFYHSGTPTNSDGGHRANCIEDLIEHGLQQLIKSYQMGGALTCLVKMGGLVVVACCLVCTVYLLVCSSVEVETNGLLDGFLLRLQTSLVAVSSRASDISRPGTGRRNGRSLRDNSWQIPSLPSFHQVFHLLSCYIAGTRHYPSKMPLWHPGAGPRHRGKQTVGHWKVRTLSATWDIHFKRCWWISWDYGRQMLVPAPTYGIKDFSPDNFEGSWVHPFPFASDRKKLMLTMLLVVLVMISIALIGAKAETWHKKVAPEALPGSGRRETTSEAIFNWWLMLVDLQLTFSLSCLFCNPFLKGRFLKKHILIMVATTNSMPILFKVCGKQSRLITRESDRTGAIRWRLSNAEVLTLLKNQILKSNTSKCIDKSKAKHWMVPFKQMLPIVITWSHEPPACWTWWTGSLTLMISTVFGSFLSPTMGCFHKKPTKKICRGSKGDGWVFSAARRSPFIWFSWFKIFQFFQVVKPLRLKPNCVMSITRWRGSELQPERLKCGWCSPPLLMTRCYDTWQLSYTIANKYQNTKYIEIRMCNQCTVDYKRSYTIFLHSQIYNHNECHTYVHICISSIHHVCIWCMCVYVTSSYIILHNILSLEHMVSQSSLYSIEYHHILLYVRTTTMIGPSTLSWL